MYSHTFHYTAAFVCPGDSTLPRIVKVRARIFSAPTVSASPLWPQETHRNSSPLRFSLDTFPQMGQVREVFRGSTRTRRTRFSCARCSILVRTRRYVQGAKAFRNAFPRFFFFPLFMPTRFSTPITRNLFHGSLRTVWLIKLSRYRKARAFAFEPVFFLRILLLISLNLFP